MYVHQSNHAEPRIRTHTQDKKTHEYDSHTSTGNGTHWDMSIWIQEMKSDSGTTFKTIASLLGKTTKKKKHLLKSIHQQFHRKTTVFFLTCTNLKDLHTVRTPKIHIHIYIFFNKKFWSKNTITPCSGDTILTHTGHCHTTASCILWPNIS